MEYHYKDPRSQIGELASLMVSRLDQYDKGDYPIDYESWEEVREFNREIDRFKKEIKGMDNPFLIDALSVLEGICTKFMGRMIINSEIK